MPKLRADLPADRIVVADGDVGDIIRPTDGHEVERVTRDERVVVGLMLPK